MSQVSDLHRRAQEIYQSLDLDQFPDRSSESWRKVRLDGVDLQGAQKNPGDLDVSFSHAQEMGPLSDFQNLGIPGPESRQSYENAGIAILDEADSEFRARQEWLLTRATETKDPFELSTIAFARPVALEIKKSGALLVEYTASNGNFVAPYLYIRVKPGVEFDLILRGDDVAAAQGSIWSSTVYVQLGDNARGRLVDMRKHGELNFHFHRVDIEQDRDSFMHYCAIHHGGLTGKGFVRTRAKKQGAEFRGVGLYTGQAAELHDMEMEITHEADHCNSSLLYKTVLRDRAHSIFNGNLVAPPHVKKVNSHQINNNIVLSKKARAESMPRLIIQSEDVACEHGATVGDLDDQALFFLQCRGVPLEQAKRMLIEGFMEEILTEVRLSDEDKEAIREQLFPILG